MSVDNIEEIQLYTKNLKLLFVEDDKDTRRTALRFFKFFFDEIVDAADGKEGLEKYTQFEPDIIFTDINLPKMDGLEMIKKINSINGKRIPVFIFSAHSRCDFIIDALKMDVDAYIVKPFVLEEFVEELGRVIDKVYKPKKDIIVINKSYSWDAEGKKLFYGCKEIKLTKNEIKLFELMTKNRGTTYSAELISTYIWYDQATHDKTNLKNLFKRLNKKLPQKLFKNIYSIGYSFIL